MIPNEESIFSQFVEDLSQHKFTYIKTLTKKTLYSIHLCSKNNFEFSLKAFDRKLVYGNTIYKLAFIQEFEIAKRIKNHSSRLVGFWDFFFTTDYAVIVYDYLKGGCLEDKIQAKVIFEINEIYTLLRDLALALKELQVLGVIHKNISPSCIYISAESTKIGGYEFCDTRCQIKFTKNEHEYFLKLVDNVCLLNPEVVLNKICNYKTPMFNLGIVLFRIFCREYPYKANNFNQIHLKYLKEEEKIDFGKNELPKHIENLIKDLLKINHINRISPIELNAVSEKLYKNLKEGENAYFIREILYDRLGKIIPPNGEKHKKDTNFIFSSNKVINSPLSSPKNGERMTSEPKSFKNVGEIIQIKKVNLRQLSPEATCARSPIINSFFKSFHNHNKLQQYKYLIMIIRCLFGHWG